ncbi:MAG: tetratricopeptide repeat protein [Endomicrobium sp.]|nr:tetratricopeptide repeat protein [Endomicrobium sp.]
MRKFILIFIICLSFGICFAENIHQTQIDNAEENFKKGDFQKTIEIYESLIRIEKVKDPYVYYNLSNAYYRAGNIGKAILNIEKALKLAPREKDIKENARFLRVAAGQKRERNIQGVLLEHFSLNEITVFLSIFIILFLLSFSLFLLKINTSVKKTIILSVIFLIICLPLFILKGCDEFSVKKAIVLSSSVVRSEPCENNPKIFTISEGKAINIISESGDWVNINVQSKGESSSGWIEAKNIGSMNE